MDEAILAAKQEAVKCAREILDGVLSPYEGARRIWMDVWPQIAEDQLGDLLLGFIGEATEWEEHPEARSEIEKAIRLKACKLIAEWANDSG